MIGSQRRSDPRVAFGALGVPSQQQPALKNRLYLFGGKPMEARDVKVAPRRANDHQAVPALVMIDPTKNQMVAPFLRDDAVTQDVGQKPILLEANVGVPISLLDNGGPRQQNGMRIRCPDDTHKSGFVDGADNNRLLAFARQERPKVVYIHMASQPTDIDHPSDRGESKTQFDDELSPEETAKRLERGLRRAFNMPPQPHGKNPTSPRAPKSKERPASKGRVHKGKTRS